MEEFLIDKRPLSAKDWAVDAGIALAAFLFGCMQLYLVTSNFVMPDETLRALLGIDAIVPSSAAYMAVALTVFPLVVRRRFPWPVFVTTLIMFLILQNLFRGYSLTIIGPLLALLTVSSVRARDESIAALALALVALLFTGNPNQSITLTFFTCLQNMAFMAAAAFAGYAYKTHKEYTRACEQRALEAERTREEVAARRVEEERVRIAREVHDIVAHSLSAVSIQAAAAERLLERDPEAAKEAIATARQTAKDALEEIRGMIGVLRTGDAIELDPMLGTDRMSDLVAYLEGAGVATNVERSEYDRSIVPAYVDAALYSIAREAVTNIVRHSKATHASIRLALESSHAILEVKDNGRGSGEAITRGGSRSEGAGATCVANSDEYGSVARTGSTDEYVGSDCVGSAGEASARGGSAESTGEGASADPSVTNAGEDVQVSALTQLVDVQDAKVDTNSGEQENVSEGHGIVGMTERARLLGGTLSAKSSAGGGFCVYASLPLSQKTTRATAAHNETTQLLHSESRFAHTKSTFVPVFTSISASAPIPAPDPTSTSVTASAPASTPASNTIVSSHSESTPLKGVSA